MTAAPQFVIYQWLSDAGYLLHALHPEFTPIEAHVDDRVETVLAALPAHTGTFAFHLNCTQTARFPADRLALIDALARRHVRVLNGGAIDISKRHIQDACQSVGLPTLRASDTGDPDELLIVKTDLNFGGDSEWALSDDDRRALGVSPGSDIIWNPSHYRVLPRAQVEPAWWADERLVIERFVKNRAGRWYRAYRCLDRLALCEFENPNDIKKVGDSRVLRTFMTRCGAAGEPDGATPGPLAALIADVCRLADVLALDIGTLDAVTDDEGGYFIIDANTTPAYNHPIAGVVEHLHGAVGGSR